MEYALFYTTNLQKFFESNFFCVHFFPIRSTDLKSAQNFKILGIFDTHT